MTAAVVDRFDEARTLLDDEWRRWKDEANENPVVEVFDKDWWFVGYAGSVIAGTTEDTVNDAGEATVTFHGDAPEARWMADVVEEIEDVHLRITQGPNVWTGKALEITEEMDESGLETVEWQGVHDFQHSKKVYCFPNPWFGAALQWPKIYIYYGPAKTGILQLLFINIMRRYQPGYAPDPDMFSKNSYSRLRVDDWAQIVDPRGLGVLRDTTMHSIIVTRMGQFHEIVEPILEDAGLRLVARRWFPGDPQPFPDHATLRLPTLIWSIEDKSGVRGPTGSVLDGFVQLVRSIAEDGVTETVEAVPYDPPIEYRSQGWWGTKVASPAVVFYRQQRWTSIEGSGQVGVKSWRRTVHKALGDTILTGGKSPGWLNSGIKMLVNAALGWIGMIFLNPGLTLGILDDQVEDVVLAFARWPFLDRGVAGRDRYGEVWETSGATGFSLSTVAAIRAGRQATRPYTSYELEIVNAAPHMVGRHFDLGDPVSAEIGRTGRLYTDELRTKRIDWDASGVQVGLSIGVDSEERTPAARLGRLLESVKQVTQNLSVQS